MCLNVVAKYVFAVPNNSLSSTALILSLNSC